MARLGLGEGEASLTKFKGAAGSGAGSGDGDDSERTMVSLITSKAVFLCSFLGAILIIGRTMVASGAELTVRSDRIIIGEAGLGDAGREIEVSIRF